jgi:hypothetical protein
VRSTARQCAAMKALEELLTRLGALAGIDVAKLGPLALKIKVSVPTAAAINNVHAATFKRNYPHLVRKTGKRREAVELGDAITLPPPPPPANDQTEAPRRRRRAHPTKAA